MVTALLALLMAAAVFLVYDRISARRALAEETAVLARVLADRSRAALVFEDRELASNNLGALAATRSVQASCVYTSAGEVFATYLRPGSPAMTCPVEVIADGQHFTTDSLFVMQPILVEKERVGALLIVADLGVVSNRLWTQAATMGVVVVIVSFVALFIATRLQRMISGPVESLANTARVVSERRDYSLRARSTHSDELGDLVNTFNEMLDTIENQNEALLSVNESLEETVEQRTTELRNIQDELMRNERLATIGQLAATVSHELRNPLGTIRNASAMLNRLARDNPESRLDRVSEIIDRNTTRCANIIEELLAFTRMRRAEPRLLDLDQWLGEQLDEYPWPAHVVPRRELSCREQVLVDSERLRQAVLNLLDNACDALKEVAGQDPLAQDVLSVSTRRVDGEVAISIRDSGIGIDAENLDRVFEPLFSTKSFGVGLGLSVVKQVMEQHDGRAEIRSPEEGGTEFVLYLPVPDQ
jgi:signal transduction histidine kinase